MKFVVFAICAILLLGFAPGARSAALTFQLAQQSGGVHIEWRDVTAQANNAAPLVTISGVRLPARLVALQVAGDAPLMPRIERVVSEPWAGSPALAEPIVPQLPGGAPRPDLAALPSAALPDSPVVLLREARLRGQRIAVLALSPFFSTASGPQALRELALTVPNAALLVDDPTSLLETQEGPFLASAPAPNPAAGNGWKIQVVAAGMQRLTASALAAAGVPLGSPSLLQLRFDGAPVALEQRGSGNSLELRFYAAAPGDRWNRTSTYWLTLGSTPGLRMATRSVAPAGAALSGFAFERGSWQNPHLYDSLLAGPDADHWFSADMRSGPGSPAAVTTAQITPTLPLVSSTATLTVTGSSYLKSAHTLQTTLAATTRTATWSGTGDWSHVLTFPAPGKTITLKLPTSAQPDGYEIDGVAWQVPVSLNLGGRGAAFAGRAGTWRYQFANVPAGGSLYDVSNMLVPELLNGWQATSTFQDGPATHLYVLAGAGTLFTPSIARSPAYDIATPARVLYIGPAALHSAIGPLVAQRRAQGLSVRVIDTQAIYDRWGYGQVSPVAIRNFLRYAAAAWANPPVAVTLVGDGTIDPLNYTGRTNRNDVPPFAANVDPWIGETACEQCFARLDGDDPTLDELPDLALGRLPARSADAMAALVNKLVAYETSPLNLFWRSRNVYVADNFRDAQNNADSAGDFAAFADASAALQPAGIRVDRIYYDPSPSAPAQPWREPNAETAYARTRALLAAGAGLANYVGHGSQFQWAVTDFNATPPYLLGQYDPDELGNGARQPIVLEMTCLTGAFQTPSYAGTIDERLLLNPNGGAIAVWSPTGQAVAHGHDLLQRGFYQKLWGSPPLSARVGNLALAGYTELFANGTCCQDTIATYALLGDAMQIARVMPGNMLYAPVAQK